MFLGNSIFDINFGDQIGAFGDNPRWYSEDDQLRSCWGSLTTLQQELGEGEVRPKPKAILNVWGEV